MLSLQRQRSRRPSTVLISILLGLSCHYATSWGLAVEPTRATAVATPKASATASAQPVPSSAPVPALVPAVVQGGPIPWKTARGFERGPDYTFVRDTKAKVTRKPVNRPRSVAALIAQDASTYFVDAPQGNRQGGVLISKKRPRGVFFPTPEVHDFAFSPSGKHLAILDDIDDSVAILAVPEGKLLRKFQGAYEMRMRDDGILLYRNKCQIYAVDPASNAEPRPLGPSTCGGAAASRNGSMWIVVSPHEWPYVRRQVRCNKMTAIDGISGTATSLEIGDSFASASISTDGRRVCYYLFSDIHCRELATGKLDMLNAIDLHGLEGLFWGRNDDLMMTVTKTEVVVFDFVNRTVRKIVPSAGVQLGRFMPGSSRAYLNGKGANIYDLETGISFEVFDKKVEVGGFFPVPNRTDRFITGKEIGNHRDLYWIDLKASPLPAAKPSR